MFILYYLSGKREAGPLRLIALTLLFGVLFAKHV